MVKKLGCQNFLFSLRAPKGSAQVKKFDSNPLPAA
jgi:hypothetical protein